MCQVSLALAWFFPCLQFLHSFHFLVVILYSYVSDVSCSWQCISLKFFFVGCVKVGGAIAYESRAFPVVESFNFIGRRYIVCCVFHISSLFATLKFYIHVFSSRSLIPSRIYLILDTLRNEFLFKFSQALIYWKEKKISFLPIEIHFH